MKAALFGISLVFASAIAATASAEPAASGAVEKSDPKGCVLEVNRVLFECVAHCDSDDDIECVEECRWASETGYDECRSMKGASQ